MSSEDNSNLDSKKKANLNLDARPSISAPKTSVDDPFSSMPDRMSSRMNSSFNSVTSGLIPDSRVSAGLSYQQAAVLSAQQEANLIKFNHLTYLLYILSFFTAGLLWIVPIVMNYIRRHEADNTWLATHFDWQIKTFWYSLVLGSIGVSLLIFSFGGLGVSALASSTNGALGSLLLMGLGGLLLAIAVLWHFYRIVRGWIALVDKRPVL